MATGWRRHGNGRHDSKPGLRAKTRRSGPACYRRESLPAAGWRKEYWRNATYTKSQTLPTNVVESLHMSLRKVIKTRGSFPSEEAALKLLYLGLRNVSKKWNASTTWRSALNHFTVL